MPSSKPGSVDKNSFKIHIQDALGCIISDVPRVIGGFGSFNIRPSHPGDPPGVDQDPDCIPATVIQVTE